MEQFVGIFAGELETDTFCHRLLRHADCDLLRRGGLARLARVAQVQTRMGGQGEHFDFVSVIPPSVPDDQNFAMTPVWIAEVKLNMPEGVKAWYGDRIYGEEVSKLASQLPISVSGVGGNVNFGTYHAPEPPNMADGDWRQTHAIGLKQWQSYYRDLGKAFPAVAIPITPQPQSPAADVLLALSKYDQIIEKLRRRQCVAAFTLSNPI